MDVFAIALEDRFAADKAANHRKARIDDRQAKRHHRNRDGDHGGSLLCAKDRRDARVNPMNKAPQSPRKIEAGLKLYRRKPISAPVIASVSTVTATLPWTNETTSITSVANNAPPAAKPSIPSIKLKALLIPTIHRTVTS